MDQPNFILTITNMVPQMLTETSHPEFIVNFTCTRNENWARNWIPKQVKMPPWKANSFGRKTRRKMPTVWPILNKFPRATYRIGIPITLFIFVGPWRLYWLALFLEFWFAFKWIKKLCLHNRMLQRRCHKLRRLLNLVTASLSFSKGVYLLRKSRCRFSV